MKKCSRCKKVLTLEKFHKNRSQPNGVTSACKECLKPYRVRPDVLKRQATVHREYNLRRFYGISLEEFNEKLAAQNGCCAICGRKQGKQYFGVDHHHTTGRLRGILCAHCNMVLGWVERPGFIKKVRTYLQEAHWEKEDCN